MSINPYAKTFKCYYHHKRPFNCLLNSIKHFLRKIFTDIITKPQQKGLKRLSLGLQLPDYCSNYPSQPQGPTGKFLCSNHRSGTYGLHHNTSPTASKCSTGLSIICPSLAQIKFAKGAFSLLRHGDIKKAVEHFEVLSVS